MSKVELPFCADCDVSKRISVAPEVSGTEPVQQVAGYVDRFEEYFKEYVEESFDELREFRAQRKRGGEVYGEEDDIVAANTGFVQSAKDTKDQIIAYLDLLPRGVGPDTLLALGQCAHKIANGDCYFTSSLPGFKEIVEEMNE